MNPYKILYEHRNNPKLYNSNKIMAVILFINIIYIYKIIRIWYKKSFDTYINLLMSSFIYFS